MMSFMNPDNVNSFPVLSVFYNLNAQEKNLNLSLPIFVHRFISPVTVEQQRYNDIYLRFTQGDQYFKLDEFIKYPAPPSVLLNEVMMKIGSLLTSLNFKVMPAPNMQKIKYLLACGQLDRANKEAPVVPLIVEIEGFEDNKEVLRLSIRCSQNPLIIHSLYQIIMFFLTL